MASAHDLAHLDSTIRSLSGGAQEARQGATRSINSWLEALDGGSYGPLTRDLQHLKAALEDESPDAAKISQTLRQLGEHTTKAAAKAEGATVEKLQELGKLLTEAAGQLK